MQIERHCSDRGIHEMNGAKFVASVTNCIFFSFMCDSIGRDKTLTDSQGHALSLINYQFIIHEHGLPLGGGGVNRGDSKVEPTYEHCRILQYTVQYKVSFGYSIQYLSNLSIRPLNRSTISFTGSFRVERFREC